jgi:hypothetical protein
MGVGNVSISDECINFIRTIIPDGSTILELGSGNGTVRLSKYFKLYSVENQTEWMNAFPNNTTYINCKTKYYDNEFTAPDVVGKQTAWYDPEDLLPNLPKNYDMILIDGPGGHWGRGGFLKYIEHFNTNVPIIFDDANRAAEIDLMIKVSEQIDRPYNILNTDKSVGYIL